MKKRHISWSLAWRVVALGLVQSYLVGWRLHSLTEGSVSSAADVTLAAPMHGGHGGHGSDHQIDPWIHFLRDSTLAAPVSIAVLLVVSLIARSIQHRVHLSDGSQLTRFAFAIGAAVAAALASAPGVAVHGWLFDEQLTGVSLESHYLGVALVTLRYTFAISLLYVAFFGVPWAGNDPAPQKRPATLPSAVHVLKEVP